MKPDEKKLKWTKPNDFTNCIECISKSCTFPHYNLGGGCINGKKLTSKEKGIRK